MDNYYNSVEMCRRLLRHKIHYASTLGVNRGEPKSIKDVTVSDLAVGKTSRHNEDIIVLAWRDKRIVRMITTHHQDEMTVQVRQKKYPFIRKSPKSSKFVVYLFQIALVNAFILYKKKIILRAAAGE